jgi:hypothetical protein
VRIGICDEPSIAAAQNGEWEMSIGKRKGAGGDFLPLVKYDARHGVIYRCDRVQTPEGWETEQHNITDNFEAVFDMDSIEVGWMLFSAGAPPSFKMVPIGTDIGLPPSGTHKQGIRLHLKLSKDCAGDAPVREFSSTSVAVWQAIDQLHDEFEDGRHKHRGKLPLVGLAEAKPVKTMAGVNYAPIFEITGWVPRPAELQITKAA